MDIREASLKNVQTQYDIDEDSHSKYVTFCLIILFLILNSLYLQVQS